MTAVGPLPGSDAGTDVTLMVEFCGERHVLGEGQSIDFGRAAAIEIDENPYLHRRCGRFEFRHGSWWLINLGSSIALVVKDLTSRSEARLAPRRELALSFPEAVVQFEAGRQNYELEISIEGFEPTDTVVLPGDEGATISHADLPLTLDQRRLIIALSEPTLRTGDATIELPSNRAAAVRLGWTITRFNRKLDNVCERLHKAGVSGLRGQLGDMATDRRTRRRPRRRFRPGHRRRSRLPRHSPRPRSLLTAQPLDRARSRNRPTLVPNAL